MTLKIKQVLLLICTIFIYQFSSAEILIQVDDGADEGFNDATYGEARLQVFEQAAAILSTYIESEIDIIVLARFDELTCTNTSATLGSASPNSTAYNFKNAPFQDTLYPIALANAIAKEDLDPEKEDIIAVFNSLLDSGNCLGGSTWHYGFGQAPPNQVSLLEVVLHELIHGLGFISTVAQDGSRLFYQWVDAEGVVLETVFLDDPFMMHLVNGSGEFWGELDGTSDESGNLTREQDSISDDLYFSGPITNSAIQDKTYGVVNGLIKMYTPSTFNGASNVSHFDISVSPNEVMEPFNTGNTDGIGLAFEVLKDIGWPGINIPPVITGQIDKSTPEDTAFFISYSDLIVQDFDNTYPNAFMLKIYSSDDFDYLNGAITPKKDFTGTLSIEVSVNDSKDESNIYELLVEVLPVNDAPEILSQNAISINEDSILLLDNSHFNIYDAESDSTEIITLSGENYQVVNNQIIPNANFNGDLRINIQVTDGQDISDVTQASVAVIAQNDDPVFTFGDEFITSVEQPFTLNLSVLDIDNDNIRHTTTNRPQWMSIQGGVLNGTPSSQDLGTHTFTVEASDGTTSIEKEISITVLEHDQVDFSITKTSQSLLKLIDTDNAISFEISGTGQSRKEAITIEFISELTLVNDLCDSIENGLSCQYSLMNTSDVFSVTTRSAQTGSYQIQASINNIPQNVTDTNPENQSTSLWVSFINDETAINTSSTDSIEFESPIAYITTDELTRTIAISQHEQFNQLINVNSQGEHALMAKFAEEHQTHKIDLIDLNNDNVLDLIATSATQTAEVYLNIDNDLVYSESFSQLPIENILQSAVINDGIYAISDADTLFILRSNLADSFITHAQIDIININDIQSFDTNNDSFLDLLISTQDNQIIIFNGVADETLFDNSGISYNSTGTSKIHASTLNDQTFILQGNEEGLNILNLDDQTLSLTQSINTGHVIDISSISGKNIFYVLNESGTIFIYEYKDQEASILSSMHLDSAKQIVHMPIDDEEVSIWASHNNHLSLFNVQLPMIESVITSTQTSIETDSNTDTQTDTSSETDTQVNTQTDTDDDASTLVSNTANNQTENIKVGSINLAWLLFGISIFLIRQKRSI